MQGHVVSVSASRGHSFSKVCAAEVTLIEGRGVAGDAHSGETVKHRSRVARDPTQPNLRQVHLIHAELLEELAGKGFPVGPGQLGENFTTRGIDLLALPSGSELLLGGSAVVRLTGLRNPCVQIERFRPGLTAAVLERRQDGTLVRKAGTMGVVVSGGIVRVGDRIAVRLPAHPHRSLEPV
jgi:MOSC domain-containing protein YiiM